MVPYKQCAIIGKETSVTKELKQETISEKEEVVTIEELLATIRASISNLTVIRGLDIKTSDVEGDLYSLVINEAEKTLMKRVLQLCRYNQTKAAKVLGINRQHFRYKMKHYGL